MSKEKRVIYYKDELNDEFADDNIIPKHIGDDYKYLHDSFFGKLAHFFWYRIIATPFSKIYLKLVLHQKIVNKKVLKLYKKQGYFMYGNHTHQIADAINPTIASFPKDMSVIVHANNVSMPVLGRITPYLGALPLPDTLKATKNFMQAIKILINNNKAVFIYPEAHIWPYYTDIRPFGVASFGYPLQLKAPVFSVTNTYQKRRFSKKPKFVTYIDGPFVLDEQVPKPDQKQALRDLVYNAMKARASTNQVKVIDYIKLGNE